MLHVVSVCTPCCILLRVVRGCRATFRTGQKADLATERERQVYGARKSSTWTDQSQRGKLSTGSRV